MFVDAHYSAADGAPTFADTQHSQVNGAPMFVDAPFRFENTFSREKRKDFRIFGGFQQNSCKKPQKGVYLQRQKSN